jgi:hypothetical protein
LGERITVEASLGKKVSETVSQPTNWERYHTYVIPAMQKASIVGSWSRHNCETLLKKTKAKRAAQVVECLFSKCKALSSNPRTTYKKKKGEEA